ncbi:MAG TPA: hypothetical protein PLC98_02885 [Anaerolineales bacterium]|nr:hypothetical protein [Anaerolineales bacterium]
MLVFFVPPDDLEAWSTAQPGAGEVALVTADPEAAARFGFPGQRILVLGPASADPWVAWFAERYPGLRVDRLTVSDPAAFQEVWAGHRGPGFRWPRWWTPGPLRVGATLSSGAPVAQLASLTAGRATAVRVPVQLSGLLPRVLAEQAPETLVVLSASPTSGRSETPQAFVTELATALGSWYQQGARLLELCPEPNLRQGGWGATWRSPEAFREWWGQAAALLRRLFPELRLGWPGLAPDWLAAIADGVGPEGFEPMGAGCDWLAVRAPWRDGRELFSVSGGLAPWLARQAWPDHLMLITGFGPIDATETEPIRAEQCVRFLETVQALPGVGAAFTAGRGAAWNATPERLTAIALGLGDRAVYSVASS